MIHGDTIRRLDEITDEGVFERLATAVLRQSDPDYRLLAHTGMNVDGKTVKAPLDAVTFVAGAVPPHMIAVHHTICERDGLENKWLHDPATVTPRRGGKPTAPAGDLVKTAQIYQEQRKQMPGLRATLILTTNREPSVDLIKAVNAAANSFGLALKIQSVSALAHYLDTDPDGQWIRNRHLGVEQERLSADLLAELSRLSVERHRPPDERGLWIDRELDQTLAGVADRALTFLVGDSGLGKSVAAYRKLASHTDIGGYGLVLPHEILAASSSLDQAVELTLQQLRPSLAQGAGRAARALSSAHSPLVLVVEDVNKAQQPAVLVEKLSAWGPSSQSQAATHRIICPVWPKILSALGDEIRKRVDALAVTATSFSEKEAVAAVERRQGQRVTGLEATAIASALGHDPLLIALHDPETAAQPNLIIGGFVSRGLERLSVSRSGEFTPAEYAQALSRLAQEMLARKNLGPSMFDVRDWFVGDPGTVTMIRHIVHYGEALRLTGSATSERLDFRHDRVRDHLLSESAASLMRQSALNSDILAEPYFAEILGLALSRGEVPAKTIEEIKTSNFLALICALQAIGPLSTQYHRTILKAAVLILSPCFSISRCTSASTLRNLLASYA